jgi:hypothetical protein
MGVCFSMSRCCAPAGVVVVDVDDEGPGEDEDGVPGVVNIAAALHSAARDLARNAETVFFLCGFLQYS